MQAFKKDWVNRAEFDRLQQYAETHPKTVLTPILLKRWGPILESAAEAWQFFLDEANYVAGEYKPMPSALESILPRPFFQKSCPDSLMVWDNLEKFLYNKGMRSQHIDYHKCGREAIVFKVHHVPDVLLKLGKYEGPTHSPLFNTALHRRVESKIEPSSKSDPIYLSAVPYLGICLGESRCQDQGLCNIPLPQEVVQKHQNTRLRTPRDMERLLNAIHMSFDDKKITNMRAHTALPDLFFLTDRRAASKNTRVEKTPHHHDLSESDALIMAACQDVQHAVRLALQREYGVGENVFRSLAQHAQGRSPSPG